MPLISAKTVLRRAAALCLWLLAAALPAVVCAQPAVLLETRAEGQSLAGQVAYFVDEGGQLQIDEVRSAEMAARFATPDTPPALAGSPHPVWFALRFRQETPQGDWVVSLPATAIQDLRFYGPFDASGRAVQAPVVTGSWQPFETRPLSSEFMSVRMRLPAAGEYTLYVRALSLTGRVYDFRVAEMADFLVNAQNKRIFDGLCYGVILAMLVYNLVLLLVFRDRTYALYVVSGAFAVLSLASFNGHVAHYLLPQFPRLSDRLNVVFPAMWILTGALFAYSFLDLRRLAPGWRWSVLGLAGVAALNVLAGIVGFQTLAQAVNEYVSLAGTGVIFVCAVQSWRRGFAPARWYVSGQAALFSTVVITVLNNWGYLDWTFIDDNGLQIGVSIEVMVFAVALGSRIRLMQAVQAELTRKTEHLIQAAETDPLTGVANRAGLAVRAQELLQHPFERTLLLLDLDKFKPVNDLYGHEAGDAVLVEVTRRIKAQLRASDVVARIGGDEFVVLLSDSLERKALEIISNRLMQTICEPVQFGGHQLSVGSSVGIARYPGNGLALADLMHAADVAMYHIKKNGRAGFAFFDDLSGEQAQQAVQSAAQSHAKEDDVVLF